jgi:hypothetical protein
LIDSDNYGKNDTKETSQGVFSKLFSISPTGNYARFNGLSDATDLQSRKGISSQKGPNFLEDQSQKIKEIIIRNPIRISGNVEQILYGTNNSKFDNISAESYYTMEDNSNNNKTDNVIVAPFTIEKKYGNGKITYVNAQGYFDTILNDLSSFNNSNIDNYQSNNKSNYFSTLANVTNIIVPDLAKEDRQFTRDFLNSTAFPGEVSRASKIRQILDNIQISSGYQTRMNSSSLLLPIINSSDGHLVADVTFASSSSRSPLSSVTNFSDENVINYELEKTETADSSLQSNKSDKNSNYEYSFKNAKIRNLKMYGSYEVIVESSDSDKLILPAFPSFTDYVAINLPEGFDITIKLSKSKPSYAEFEIIEANDDNSTIVNGAFHRLRIYGSDDTMARSLRLSNINSNEIHFRNTSSDLTSNGYTTLLMKSPQIQVIEEGAASGGIQSNYMENNQAYNVNSFLTFRNSPQTEPIEIVNKAGSKESVIFRIDYVDSYSEPYGEEKKNHYLTYVNGDIKVVGNNINNNGAEKSRDTSYQRTIDMPDIRFPGDISELAKKQGIDVPWEEIMISGGGLLLVIMIIITAILATKIAEKMNSWTKIKS